MNSFCAFSTEQNNLYNLVRMLQKCGNNLSLALVDTGIVQSQLSNRVGTDCLGGSPMAIIDVHPALFSVQLDWMLFCIRSTLMYVVHFHTGRNEFCIWLKEIVRERAKGNASGGWG